jgi:pyruvate/2-oxoglutarate dehydrogenase complex dihydrolipoamide dehydrogenase (E3) component
LSNSAPLWREDEVDARALVQACINLVCIPSKTLIRSAEVVELARRAGEFGVTAAVADAQDAAALRGRTQSVVRAMRAMNFDQFRASGMELVIGKARFVAPRRAEVVTDS